MIADAILIERVLIYGVLGLRFWDGATDQAIGDGLRVAATPAGMSAPWVEATSNRSGVFAFHRLPGLHSTPFEKADCTRAYIIEVHDEFERYLPFRFTAHACSQLMTALETVTGSPLAPDAG